MKDLGSDVVTECPCCSGDLFEMIDSYFNSDDGYEVKWQCQNCEAIWLEQFSLTNTMLLREGK